MKRFFAALVLAPIVGALAGSLALMIGALLVADDHERTLYGAAWVAGLFGFWALLICFAYTVVIGSAAFACARLQHRRLPLDFALSMAILCGAIPFSTIAVLGNGFTGQALIFLAMAFVCSIATAWTFWRVALAEANA